MEIKYTPLPFGQFYPQEFAKNAIYIHHSVSGDNPQNVVAAWEESRIKVGAHFIITRTGEIHNVIPIISWIHHLGCKYYHLNRKTNLELNQRSIAIELLNWGPLTPTNNNKLWVNAYGNTIHVSNTVTYKGGYRGHDTFEEYPKEQLSALEELLTMLIEKTGIKIHPDYDPQKIFEIYRPALDGMPGIFTHAGVRPDKSDCHPQPELIQLLSKFKKK